MSSVRRWVLGASLMGASLVGGFGCEEPPPPPEPETPAVEERPAPTPPPELAELPTQAVGRGLVAFVDVGSNGFEFDATEVEAGFGAEDDRRLLVLSEPSTVQTQRKVRVVSGPLAVGSYAVATGAQPGEGEVGIALDSLGQLRVVGGTLEVTAVSDEAIEGTLDLQVRHLLGGSEPTQLRARFHANREPFYDGQLQQERIIRNRLKKGR